MSSTRYVGRPLVFALIRQSLSVVGLAEIFTVTGAHADSLFFQGDKSPTGGRPCGAQPRTMSSAVFHACHAKRAAVIHNAQRRADTRPFKLAYISPPPDSDMSDAASGPSTTTVSANTPTSRLLPNKVVVITGASQGIGRAVAIGEQSTR